MKTFPDFTWEWIVKACEAFCNDLKHLASHENMTEDRFKNYFQAAQGLLTVVPKLRAHRQLEVLVPMKSLLTLRWFPTVGCEVALAFDEDQSKYRIWAGKGLSGQGEVFEERFVPLEEAADTVYACITKYRQD